MIHMYKRKPTGVALWAQFCVLLRKPCETVETLEAATVADIAPSLIGHFQHPHCSAWSEAEITFLLVMMSCQNAFLDIQNDIIGCLYR